MVPQPLLPGLKAAGFQRTALPGKSNPGGATPTHGKRFSVDSDRGAQDIGSPPKAVPEVRNRLPPLRCVRAIPTAFHPHHPQGRNPRPQYRLRAPVREKIPDVCTTWRPSRRGALRQLSHRFPKKCGIGEIRTVLSPIMKLLRVIVWRMN